LLDKGLSLYYVSAFKLFNDLCDGHFGHKGGYDAGSPVLTSDVLVIDDLGAEIISSVTIAYFTDIINQRTRNGGSTIISTNYSISEIFDKYTERVGSRFAQNYRLFRLYGADVRLRSL
ncbi:MAG: DNA replication protein DnaC, partial [Firmicutes bacterium]|nr:DNA replication protein DnaC [Bacillota bacterium]